MSVEAIIVRYGLIAVAIGCAVEGEPFALAGGLMAHDRLASLPAAVACAIGGALAVDQGWFFLARRFREQRLIRAIRDRPAFAHALGWLRRRPLPFLCLFRFAYGLRAVAPVAVAIAGVPARRYVPVTLVAAILWGAGFTLIGYGFGETLGHWVDGRPVLRALLWGVPLAAFVLVPALTLRRAR